MLDGPVFEGPEDRVVRDAVEAAERSLSLAAEDVVLSVRLGEDQHLRLFMLAHPIPAAAMVDMIFAVAKIASDALGDRG